MEPIRCGAHTLSFERTLVMGVLNVTPDSFSDGGAFLDPETAIARAHEMAREGADIIDVGGESSRPGSDPVSEEEELRRTIPVIEALVRGGLEVPISIDTCKSAVARAALDAGASIVNDISGLRDPGMIEVAASRGAPVVIMHMQGTPKRMQHEPRYEDVVREVRDFLAQRASAARERGVHGIILDPGIGFGKTLAHNLALLAHLDEIAKLGYPVLVGASRKSFLGAITPGLAPGERLEGSLAAAAIAVTRGARIVRAHDVVQTRRALALADAVRRA